jgi:hypothetical protein
MNCDPLRHSILLLACTMALGGCAGAPEGSDPSAAQGDALLRAPWGGSVSSGVTREYTCNRVDGEGQSPAWVCQ